MGADIELGTFDRKRSALPGCATPDSRDRVAIIAPWKPATKSMRRRRSCRRGSFRDYGPRTAGRRAEKLRESSCAVSSSLELFKQAARGGRAARDRRPRRALGNESRVIDRRVRRRLETLSTRTSTWPGATSRSTPPRDRQQRATRRELGVEVERPFMELGIGGHDRPKARGGPARPRPRAPYDPDALASRGTVPGTVKRVAIVSGGARIPDRRRSRGLRRLHHRRAGRTEPGPGARAGHHLRRRGHHATEMLGRPALVPRNRRRLRPRVGIDRRSDPV